MLANPDSAGPTLERIRQRAQVYTVLKMGDGSLAFAAQGHKAAPRAQNQLQEIEPLVASGSNGNVARARSRGVPALEAAPAE